MPVFQNWQSVEMLVLNWKLLLTVIIMMVIALILQKTTTPSARQHPSYGDCLEVRREYYQNCAVLDCVTQCSQSAAHLYEQFLQVQRIGFVILGPLCVHLPKVVPQSAVALHCCKAHERINRKTGNSTPCKIVTPENFSSKVCTRD